MKKIFLCLLSFVFSLSANAEMSTDVRAVYDRMDRLERDITLMQRRIYKSGSGVENPTQDASIPANLKAGSLEHLYTKISELEAIISQTTAQIEDLSHQVSQLQTDLNKINTDIDYRFSEIKETNKKSSESVQPSLQKKEEGVTLKDSKEAYEEAYKLLNAQKYAEAQTALENFLKNYPDDALAGNAQYWLGETFYVRELYEPAAIAFATGVKKYKSSTKGADNLLKLGFSMEKLEKKKEACTAFKSLKKEFPKASSVVLSRATQEIEKLGCNK